MDIVPTDHAIHQMRRRGITLSDMTLVLELGTHVEGLEGGTLEALTDGPLRLSTTNWSIVFETDSLS